MPLHCRSIAALLLLPLAGIGQWCQVGASSDFYEVYGEADSEGKKAGAVMLPPFDNTDMVLVLLLSASDADACEAN